MKKAKTLTMVTCAVLAVIVALQNTETVDTQLLFFTVSMPRALLLIVTLLIGAAAGLVAGTLLGSRKKQASPSE